MVSAHQPLPTDLTNTSELSTDSEHVTVIHHRAVTRSANRPNRTRARRLSVRIVVSAMIFSLTFVMTTHLQHNQRVQTKEAPPVSTTSAPVPTPTEAAASISASSTSRTSRTEKQVVPASSGTASSAPQPYPERAVAVYLMMWSSSGSPPLAQLPAGINVVNLAFAQGDPPALTGWGSDAKERFIAAAKQLRSRGVRIVVSVGGENGHVNVSNRQAFVNGILAINTDIPLDGLDWDLEGPAMTQDDVVWISQELKKRRGTNFAISMAPNGNNIDQYREVAIALNRAGALDMIGQQFYDHPVTVDAMRGRLKQLHDAGIPDSKIGIGTKIGDDENTWTVAESVAALQAAKQRHPQLRGVYLWEAGHDATALWAQQMSQALK